MKTANERTEYKIGSLFAGVGGICQAFKDVGCRVVWANENSRYSCQTYRLNHPETTLFEKDIQLLSSDELEKVDILTAGFPCQPFSVAGHGKGFDDPRGELFYEIIRLLNELQPAAFFLENVKTLATHSGGKSFRIVKDAIKQAGYSFLPFVLKAHEYSEIPQGRERIYIVGFKGEPEYSFDKPIKETAKLILPNFNGETLLSASFQIPAKFAGELKKVKDFCDTSTAEESDYYREDGNIIHQRVCRDAVDEDKVYHYRRWYVRENKSGVCPTLTANMGLGGHNIPIIKDGTRPRRLTPKECFNLQGFSRSFRLPEGIPNSHLYRQAGNTVVVPLVARIASEIVRVLNEYRDSQT